MTGRYLATENRDGAQVCLYVYADNHGRIQSIQEARFMLDYDDAPVVYETIARFVGGMPCAA